MQALDILILGGTGFIGQRVCAHLAGDMHRLVVPTRRLRSGRDLLLLPTIRLREADIHDDACLRELIADADVVINLVGVLHSDPGQPYGKGFERMHVALPRRIARLCTELGDKRLIHVSALGADQQRGGLPSAYLRSKADGEKAVREHGPANATIFRPSVVFGPGDNFLNLFARLQRVLPVMALGRSRAQLQPVYVGDVAHAIGRAVASGLTHGKTYELVGPEIYTLRELVHLAGRLSGHPRPIIALPDALGRLQARLLEWMPGPPLMTRDNFDSLAKPNIASQPMAPELAMPGTSLITVAPGYLQPRDSAFSAERAMARR
ncbi:MAG: complex I NDUFA9 subunit family protein [Burkholderiaceae bacterium]